jgi:hypothetical protein
MSETSGKEKLGEASTQNANGAQNGETAGSGGGAEGSGTSNSAFGENKSADGK